MYEVFCDNADSTDKSLDWEDGSEVTGKYYRFEESFNALATGYNNDGYNCGADVGGYIADPNAHNIAVGQRRTNVNVCFGSHRIDGFDGCERNITIKVTRCPGDPDYFVYYLPNAPCTDSRTLRYCGGRTGKSVFGQVKGNRSQPEHWEAF